MKLDKLFSLFFLIVGMLTASQGFCFYLHHHVTPTYDLVEPITITEENSGLESIDCIYVINLDKRPERLAHFKAQCEKNGIRANRVRGVDGLLIPYTTIRKVSGTYPANMRPGQFGCLLSHISIYKDAYERGFSRIWIFEDDVSMEMDLHLIPKLLENLTSIDPDWDIFYTDVDSRDPWGGYWKPYGLPVRPDQPKASLKFLSQRIKVTIDIWRTRSRWGCYSYILSRKGIEKIYNYFSHVYLFVPIDVDVHLIPGIREYSSAKAIVSNPRHTEVSDTLA